jgi:hypothetical protein
MGGMPPESCETFILKADPYRRREEEREREAEERREQEVRTRGGMPSPYNTNEFILAEHADETTRKLGQLYFHYISIYTNTVLF